MSTAQAPIGSGFSRASTTADIIKGASRDDGYLADQIDALNDVRGRGSAAKT